MREIAQKIIKGSIWVLGLQVLQRSLALVRTLILARILAPEDFGLFALASIMIVAFEVFTRTGFEDALIHFRDKWESYLHTSYWIQVLRGGLLAILCLFLAPILGKIFHERAVVEVAQFMALTQLVRGFRSIGIVLLRREMNFKRESQFNLIFVVVSFIATIGFSLYLKDVWGMVYGFFAGEAAATIVSFYFHPYRPRFEFRMERAASLWNYGVWLFLSGIVSFLALNLDKIFIGRFLNAETLGIYYMAFYLANLPTVEFARLIGGVTQPAYAILQNDQIKLTEAFSGALRYTFLFVAPAAIGMALLSPKYTSLILGEKWGMAALPLSFLALGGLFRSIAGLGAAFFKATGKPKPILVIEFQRALTLLILLYFGYSLAGLNGIAAASAISSFLVFPVTLYYLHKRLGNFNKWISGLGKPVFSTFVMGVSVFILGWISSGDWFGLLFIITAGVVTYGIVSISVDKSILPAIKSLTK